jgi:hypothetical protein
MAVEIGESGIIAAIVSAVVAIAILTVKEFAIESRRWRKNIRVSNLEKRLQIYGELITILKSCEHKAMRKHLDDTDSSKSNRVASHVLENPFDGNRLQEIFEKSHYLLSTKLLDQWYRFIMEDEFLAFFRSKKSIYESEKTKDSSLLVDFREMQCIAQTEYAELKQQYDLLVPPDRDDSNFLPNNNKL